MTTTSKESNLPDPAGEHWEELSDTISIESKAQFAHWLDKELEVFDELFEEFVTKNSLRKSLHR